jgi:diacylglycerol kinase family enzyme
MPQVDHAVVLTNAAAGSADDDVLGQVRSTLTDAGVRVDVHRLGSPEQGGDGSAVAAVNALPDLDGAALVLAGGDGTVHAVVHDLFEADLLSDVGPVAVLPMGTGNDLAGGAGIPDDPVDAARLVLDGTPQRRDLLVDDGGGVVVNAVHVGIGALASQRSTPLKSALGPLAYPVGAVLAGSQTEGWPLVVQVDGETVVDGSHPLLMVGVAVGSRIGGGTPLAPAADPSDGWADLVVVSAVGPLARVGFARALRLGDHGQRDDVLVSRAHRVRIDGCAVPVNADGEIEPDVQGRTWTVLPSAWSLLVPTSSG